MTPNSVKLLYLIINNANGYIEESNVNKSLTLVPTDESKDKLKKYGKIWGKNKGFIRSTYNNSDDYVEKYIKSNFIQLMIYPRKTTLKFYDIITIVRSVFNDSNKYYPQNK